MQKNIDLDLLRTFLAICDTGKFSIAATRVGRTQSAVSQQITRLEDLFGQPLFERTTKKLKLTVSGEILYDYAQKMMELNEETFLRVSDNEITGILRLGAPEVLTYKHLPKILSAFNKSHPSVLLDVDCKLTDDLLEDFEKGAYDVLIFISPRNRKQTLGQAVYKEKLAWLKAKDKDFHKQSSLPLVLSPHPCVYRHLAIETLEQNKVNWRTIMTAHSLSGRISAVKSGLGISLMPIDLIDDDLEICPDIPLSKPISSIDIAVAVNEQSDKNLSQSFTNHMLRHFNVKESYGA